ncbi:MAG: ribonuclease III, partial [Staphylococcus equorum]|nr:ribonuclease III [Staphylococcus equorum]
MVKAFEKKFAQKMQELDLNFKQIELYQQAFSHSSFIN